MKFKNKAISYFFLTIIFTLCFIFSAEASSENEISVGKFYSSQQKLICISHRGDTVNYPENSLEGIISALEKGADFVSVGIEKSSDGVFYLCESESLGNVCDAPYDSLSQVEAVKIDSYSLYDIYGNLTEYKMTSLNELLDKTDSTDGIILDIKAEDKDAVYDVLYRKNAVNRVIIRVNESASKLVKWAENKAEKANVIPVYSGNIIFSTVSSINCATSGEMPAVQFNSKNYFNVAFGSFFADRYLTKDKARAVTATYSPELCGQRNDSSDGWNELINKGYSVIETKNIDSFIDYRTETQRLEEAIVTLLEKSSDIEPDKYSQVSLLNLDKAKKQCGNLLDSAVFSLDEAQDAYSSLIFALEDMKIFSGEVDTRGALNVTAGKVVAAILVGSVLLAGQVYIYKMSKKKNKE